MSVRCIVLSEYGHYESTHTYPTKTELDAFRAGVLVGDNVYGLGLCDVISEHDDLSGYELAAQSPDERVSHKARNVLESVREHLRGDGPCE